MTYNSFSYSSIGEFSQFQSKVGMKVPAELYVGPEANLSWRNQMPAANNIAQLRLGAHVSGWKVGPVFFSLSGGWAHDQQLGSGQYISLNLYTSF
jgi:hypothetical protein